jgi:hypothetical protein
MLLDKEEYYALGAYIKFYHSKKYIAIYIYLYVPSGFDLIIVIISFLAPGENSKISSRY